MLAVFIITLKVIGNIDVIVHGEQPQSQHFMSSPQSQVLISEHRASVKYRIPVHAVMHKYNTRTHGIPAINND